MNTSQRLERLRDSRRDRYEALVRHGAAADCGGPQLTEEALMELERAAMGMGIHSRDVSADLGAARSWHVHTAQLSEATAGRATAEKAVAKGENELKTAFAQKSALQQERQSKDQVRAMKQVCDSIAWLRDDLKAARVPLARCESSTRALKALQIERPWLRIGE